MDFSEETIVDRSFPKLRRVCRDVLSGEKDMVEDGQRENMRDETGVTGGDGVP